MEHCFASPSARDALSGVGPAGPQSAERVGSEESARVPLEQQNAAESLGSAVGNDQHKRTTQNKMHQPHFYSTPQSQPAQFFSPSGHAQGAYEPPPGHPLYGNPDAMNHAGFTPQQNVAPFRIEEGAYLPRALSPIIYLLPAHARTRVC